MGRGWNDYLSRARAADPAAHRSLLYAAAGLSVAIGAVLYCRHFASEAPGLMLFTGAARCMVDGAPLQSCDPTFTYPPIFAFATIPLIALPRALQNLVWYIVTVGSLAGCVAASALLARRLVPDRWWERDTGWLYVIGTLLGLKFCFAAIGNQSYDAVVIVLILIGLAGLAEERGGGPPIWAGASFACAAALKATPLLFLPYLVVRRHYRTAAVMAVVLAFLSVLPDLVFAVGRKSANGSYLLAWLNQVAGPALSDKMQGNPHTFWFAANPSNNSLRGLVGLFIEEPHPDFTLILYAVYAAYAASVGLVILAAPNGPAAPTIDGALLLVSMLMLSPMTSQSHYVALLLPIFGAVAIWLKGDSAMRRLAGMVLIATALLTNATSRDLVGPTLVQWAKEHRLLIADALLFVAFYVALALRSKLVRSAGSIAISHSPA